MSRSGKALSCAAKRKQAGLSMVELMIAMVLGLIVLGSVVNMFLSSSQTYRLQDAMSRTQEAGRFAMMFMLQDLRDAGFQDVLPLANLRSLDVIAVRGYAKGASGLPADVKSSVTSEVISIPQHQGLSSTGVVSYYVAPDAGGNSSLFRNGNAVVEGIQDMMFEYGEDTSGDRQADAYVAPGAVTNWANVVAVRLHVLAVAGDANVVDAAQATLAAPFASVSTSDKRLYRAFHNTVALRNKMP